jgi:uncharacterized protein
MDIPRFIQPGLVEHLDKEEITLLIGPRQAGKTTLLRKIADQLIQNGATCLFFNLDIDTDAQHFSSQQRFVERVEALSTGKQAYVFIDEVQRIENAGLFLKGIYDRRLPHKWIATGSGSLELKEKIAESLAGRKRNFLMYPISVDEFLSYRYSANLSQSIAQISTDTFAEERLLLEYLQYGGYPKVVTASNQEEKRKVLAEIFQSFVERDLQILLRLEKSRELITLLQLLSNRIGRLVNYQDLANMTNLSVPTVKNYLWYCQKTFIIEEVLPFFTNKEKELTKTPQYYFVDSGLRNFLLNSFGLTPLSADFGFLFQQLIFQLLKSRFSGGIEAIRYWRTQNQAEVDFVVQNGLVILPIEVKAERMKKPQVERSLRNFIATYAPEEAWIVNRGLNEQVLIDQTVVKFIPWYELLKPTT